MKPRPTIDELEAILNAPNPPMVSINPDGTVVVVQSERDQLYGFVNGLLGLLQLLRSRGDISSEAKEVMQTNHRAVDAAAYLTQIAPPTIEH